MGKFVATSDFTGKHDLPENCAEELQAFIDRYEEHYIKKLLGAELFDLFIADLDINNDPQTARFVDIFNAFHKDDDQLLVISRGIKDMLLGFIYFEFVRNANNRVTSTGTIRQNKSISENIDVFQADVMGRYNEAVETFNAIQWYILVFKPEDYPEENGQSILPTTGI